MLTKENLEIPNQKNGQQVNKTVTDEQEMLCNKYKMKKATGKIN